VGDAPAGALEVEFTSSEDVSWLNLVRLTAVIEFAAESLELQGGLGVRLTTDAEISSLHLQFMGIPEPTDVITFPADDSEAIGYLGDIAVSFETAAAQAGEAGHSTGREVAFLCLHGLLHLARHNDQDPTEREQMLTTQEELLNAFERRHPGGWENANHG
jgi:probable rRNA maturation factor